MNNYYGFRVCTTPVYNYLLKVIYLIVLFQVLVHSPFSYPEVTGKGFAIGQAKETFIAVGARYTKR